MEKSLQSDNNNGELQKLTFMVLVTLLSNRHSQGLQELKPFQMFAERLITAVGLISFI